MKVRLALASCHPPLFSLPSSWTTVTKGNSFALNSVRGAAPDLPRLARRSSSPRRWPRSAPRQSRPPWWTPGSGRTRRSRASTRAPGRRQRRGSAWRRPPQATIHRGMREASAGGAALERAGVQSPDRRCGRLVRRSLGPVRAPVRAVRAGRRDPRAGGRIRASGCGCRGPRGSDVEASHLSAATRRDRAVAAQACCGHRGGGARAQGRWVAQHRRFHAAVVRVTVGDRRRWRAQGVTRTLPGPCSTVGGPPSGGIDTST